MLVKIEIIVLLLIALYTIICIVGAVVNLKRVEDTKRRVKRLERAHTETRELVYKLMWDKLEEREKFEPMKEGETCGSISLDKLPD